jgi:hypothetical protein
VSRIDQTDDTGLSSVQCYPKRMRRWRCGPLIIAAMMTLTPPMLSCTECNRDGCDALGQTATQGGTGVGGVVAESSDLVKNGCEECPLGKATLRIWRVDAPIASESDAVALLTEREPDVTQDVSGRYRYALEAGQYLLCVRTNCINLGITANETLTVNIKGRDGPTGFFVGSGASTSLKEDYGFDVG